VLGPIASTLSPGRGWCYSNVGYFFIRQIIEEATGQNIESALREVSFSIPGARLREADDDCCDLADSAWGNPYQYDPGWVYPWSARRKSG